jgi:hypothetical protein
MSDMARDSSVGADLSPGNAVLGQQHPPLKGRTLAEIEIVKTKRDVTPRAKLTDSPRKVLNPPGGSRARLTSPLPDIPYHGRTFRWKQYPMDPGVPGRLVPDDPDVPELRRGEGIEEEMILLEEHPLPPAIDA